MVGGEFDEEKTPSATVPAVSVIIPTYQTSQYIAQALDSVLGQTFQDFELIVVNDGSPDTPELERVLQPYMSRIVYIKQPNGGSSEARNAGIRSSRAPLIAQLDSDDFWHEDFLATQIRALAENPTVDAVYPDAFLINEPKAAGKTYMDIFPSNGEVTFLSLMSKTCNVMGPGMIIRRAILERAGLYDPELRFGEDLDLWLRIVKLGGRITYHHRPVYYLRCRTDRLSRNSIGMCEAVLRVLEKNEKMFALSGEEQAALDRARKGITADLQLERGRMAFFNGDVPSALRDIALANEFHRRWKLRFVLALMRTAPGLLRTLARIRSRQSP